MLSYFGDGMKSRAIFLPYKTGFGGSNMHVKKGRRVVGFDRKVWLAAIARALGSGRVSLSKKKMAP